MLETGDQAVHGEGVAPGNLDAVEGRRPFQAVAAGQAPGRQGQGALDALPGQPGQVGLAAGADRQLAARGTT
ncbi:hypothetical protein D3C80_1782210 [compost metagenome]